MLCRFVLRHAPKAHLPPTLIFLRSSSIASSRTPRPFMVAFVLFSSRPSCEMLCSLTGIPDYIARESMRSDCPTRSGQLTSASSNAITFSNSMSGSISTLYVCPRSFTNVSRIDECGGIRQDEYHIKPNKASPFSVRITVTVHSLSQRDEPVKSVSYRRTLQYANLPISWHTYKREPPARIFDEKALSNSEFRLASDQMPK